MIRFAHTLPTASSLMKWSLSTVLSLTTLFVFLDSPRGFAASFSLQDLGLLADLSSRTDAQPNAISADGRVAASSVTNGAYHAFVYDGQWRDLGTLGGGESLCASVDTLGRAVGRSRLQNGQTHAFLWTPGATDGVPANPEMKDLGTFGGADSEAYSINASGQISGFAQTTSEDHAFLISSGNMTDVGATLNGGLVNSYGLGLNDLGHVVGIAYTSAFATSHAFYYDGVTAKDIGTLGGASANALAINNSEQIAGYSAADSGSDHAFRYENGTMTDLGTLGGGYSYAVGINNNGVIVGGSFVDKGNTTYHAFVCTNTTMVDLNTLIDASGTGWTLTEARAINDSGKIVGFGQFGGKKHAFLLNPIVADPGPSITGISFAGNDVALTFTTSATADYVVEERDDFETGAWVDAVTGIVGTGNTVTATVPGAAGQNRRFYRVRLVPR